MNYFKLNLGERRRIFFEVSNEDNIPFTIRNHKWELYKCEVTPLLIDSGICNIDVHTLSVLVSPKEVGSYSLVITFEIADEVIKRTVEISVKENTLC